LIKFVKATNAVNAGSLSNRKVSPVYALLIQTTE